MKEKIEALIIEYEKEIKTIEPEDYIDLSSDGYAAAITEIQTLESVVNKLKKIIK
jgi:hypothetical protein